MQARSLKLPKLMLSQMVPRSSENKTVVNTPKIKLNKPSALCE